MSATFDPAELLAHAEGVRALARRLAGDDHAGDDVVQEACLVALTHPPAAATPRRAWFVGVVRHLVHRVRRSDGRRSRREHAAARPEAVRPAALAASEIEAHRLVVEAVAALADPYRTAIVFRYLDGLTPREIAARLSVPDATVRTWIHRGLGMLRERLASDRGDWLGALGPLLLAPRNGLTTARIATGVAMKVSMKALVVSLCLLAATAAVVLAPKWSSSHRDGTEVSDLSGASRPRGDGGDRAPPTRRPRRRGDDNAQPKDDAATASTLDRPATEHRGAGPARPRPSSVAEMLDFLSKSESPPVCRRDLVDDVEKYAKFFVREKDLPPIDPATAEAEKGRLLPDGTHVVFPAGVHRWDPGTWQLGTFSPGDPGVTAVRDLLVEGAGMDETLVTLEREVEIVGKARGLTFRNLTVHCDGHALIAMTGGSVLVHLDHCRVVGFDCGGNSGDLFRGCGFGILAEDSRIESGFGSSPGAGFLFNTHEGTRTRDYPTLARFDRCTIRGPFRPADELHYQHVGFFRPWYSLACVFSHCTLCDTAPSDKTTIDAPGDGVRFEECTVTYADDKPCPPRDVSELNSAWHLPEEMQAGDSGKRDPITSKRRASSR